MSHWQAWMACGLLMSLPAAVQADIFRWDNGLLIPGTEVITPGPLLDLSSWNSQQRNLRFANFQAANLTAANFSSSWLDNARFSGANLTNASLESAILTNTDLSGANLTDADLGSTTLTNANFSGAVVAGANFASLDLQTGGVSGITLPQLYSTASYQQKNLRDIGLSGHGLTSGDFSGQDLAGADFVRSMLTGANFSGANLADAKLSLATMTNANFAGAVVAGANFASLDLQTGGGSGITLPQLYSTASYQQKNLRGIGLSNNDLTGGDFSGQDLTGADLRASWLTRVNFVGAVVAGANFYHFADGGYEVGSGITLPQLFSTASYQQKNLWGIRLSGYDLTGVDFSGQDLTGANVTSSTLTNANFSFADLTNADLQLAILTSANLSAAVVTGANFGEVTSRGFTKEQLYSTASYQHRNLNGINFSSNDLTGWDFSGQDLTDAQLYGATLTNANLAGAVIAGADFHGTTSRGFTKEQLYSTASYQHRNLRGIRFVSDNLTGWDFSGQDLAGAFFLYSTLTNANFSFADLRGAQMPPEPIQLARNTIRERGAINGLELAAGETLVVRDSDIGITVNDSMHAVSGGTLELVLDDAEWGSTMAVAAGVTPDLGGTLRVRFADQANLGSMLGTTFDFFDWPAVLEANNRFDVIELPPGTQWDLNHLYLTGTAKLTAIPEPSAALLFACGTAAWILGGAFRERRHARNVSSEGGNHSPIDLPGAYKER